MQGPQRARRQQTRQTYNTPDHLRQRAEETKEGTLGFRASPVMRWRGGEGWGRRGGGERGPEMRLRKRIKAKKGQVVCKRGREKAKKRRNMVDAFIFWILF